MDKTMKRLCLLVFLAIPSALPQGPAPSPASAATALWDRLQAVNWGASYASWQRAHPQLTCRTFPSGEHATIPADVWSYRCSETGQFDEAEWIFYALTLNEPVTARLELFRAVVPGPSLARLEATHFELSNHLSSRYGAARDPGRVHEVGSAF